MPRVLAAWAGRALRAEAARRWVADVRVHAHGVLDRLNAPQAPAVVRWESEGVTSRHSAGRRSGASSRDRSPHLLGRDAPRRRHATHGWQRAPPAAAESAAPPSSWVGPFATRRSRLGGARDFIRSASTIPRGCCRSPTERVTSALWMARSFRRSRAPPPARPSTGRSSVRRRGRPDDRGREGPRSWRPRGMPP
jgi:hypothetical protein